MSHFVIGWSKNLVEECRSSMLHDDMNISLPMVHAQEVEETRLRRKNREAKKARSYEGGYSKGRLDIKDKPRFKKISY